ncbi:MAG: GIY-YIG nuclease family protein [Paludibacter sp.]|nr:GIY-YIG nuclease family protein [Paludibacter sp.]
MSKKLTIDDIFNDDDFGMLDSKPQTSGIKTEEDRLIESFEEINVFVDKNNREPGTSSMSEYGLTAKLKTIRQDDAKKRILKPFDRHDLLGHVEIEKLSIDDILNEDDDLLNTQEELSIFKFKNIPNPEERAEADFVAQRKPMKEKEFKPYEVMFQKVHQEIKEGRRKLVPFKDLEKHLQKGHFYIADGVMLYLEDVIFERDDKNLAKETSRRKDGRTRTVFENGTYSNMLYRSLGKQLQINGKLVTNTDTYAQNELFVNANLVKEEDIQTGWIYVLKSKSTDPKISSIKDLYKIGFSTTPVDERIKNAKNEATYLFADVKKVTSYNCYNRNADKLEQLLHRFFASSCLNIDLFDEKGQRITPREWFVVPLEVIEEAIQMILNESILDYKYDNINRKIIAK